MQRLRRGRQRSGIRGKGNRNAIELQQRGGPVCPVDVADDVGTAENDEITIVAKHKVDDRWVATCHPSELHCAARFAHNALGIQRACESASYIACSAGVPALRHSSCIRRIASRGMAAA